MLGVCTEVCSPSNEQKYEPGLSEKLLKSGLNKVKGVGDQEIQGSRCLDAQDMILLLDLNNFF
uniref:Uncharacterized protein n=1 Tax=Romanomermis culicivorax TaxID=13658 RepID=A0A915JHV5_ROMCU